MQVQTYSPGSVVIPRGTNQGERIWVVVNGRLNKYVTFDVIGDTEMVLNDIKGVFHEDIVAEETTDVAELSISSFEKCVGGRPSVIREEREAIGMLRQVHLLRSIPDENFHTLMKALKIIEYTNGEIIVK